MVLAAALSSGQGGIGFERYEVILNRRPFAATVAVSVAQPPAGPAEILDTFKPYRLCAITVWGDTIRVGLIDTEANPPKPYFLQIGDSEDGLELLEASFDRSAVLLAKGTQEQWLSLEGDASGQAPVPQLQAPPPTIAFALRLRQRRELLRKRNDERAAKEEAEKSPTARLHGIQMDRLRRGESPLPFELTQEMDDQLVLEGILPPGPGQDDALPAE